MFGIRLHLSAASAHMVAARRGGAASFSSLCLSSSDSLLRPPDALTVDPITSPWLESQTREIVIVVYEISKTDICRSCLFVSGGYLFSRPRLPQCGMVVQRRRRSSNSLPYWISCSLHRPPGALTVDPITSPWLESQTREIVIVVYEISKTDICRSCLFVSGGYLFSRAVTSQVSSAYKGLTSVFGMRTGGSP